MLKQKLIGVLFILIAVIVPFLLDGDITASLFMGPLGLCLIFSKTDWIYTMEEDKKEEL